MTDRFTITPLPRLLQIILNQIDKESLFGIPSELFFQPRADDPFRLFRFNQLLETPVGVAAGPHTQLTQNIVLAWLMGARYVELKTIQTLDELDVAKPCIDMQDEGYNCEWSQELKVHESFDQYLDAWIIIHILKHKFGWGNEEAGAIFNMSVGYDYNGIQNENVQWFLDKMSDASVEIEQKLKKIKSIYPKGAQLNINPCVSNNITLSTMHGCPVDEIEKIGKYLIEEKKLHTSIKLNPTLLGEFELHQILDNSGFETRVPPGAFEHDPKFEEVIIIIRNLEKSAQKNRLHFGLKLTNTLESRNFKDVFPSSEEMMYMSGRALHPISINVAAKLQKNFGGKLDISFCAGIDAFNIVDVVNCGLSPVTVCSDLLKPGGYGRLAQYIEYLRKSYHKTDSNTSLKNLRNYAQKVLDDDHYKKTDIVEPDIKTSRELTAFDCISAPCVDTCPTHQDIPDYLYYTSKGQIDKAGEVILKTNPFPRTTGMICDHPCQLKCTLINYEKPVQIREVKRFIAENSYENGDTEHIEKKDKAAIIGAGPSGFSCAYFLAKSGFDVSVYEKKPVSGGMVSGAIPSFRLTDDAFESDINHIKSLGVKFYHNTNIDEAFFEKIREENDFIYIATGAQKSSKLGIENIKTKGVIDPLQFLFDAKENKTTGIGKNVIIIGGGNTAMDAARTAFRLVGEDGKVSIVYRRTKKQMPADIGEIRAVMEEGIDIHELTNPIKVNVNKHNHVHSLSCIKMELIGIDEGGRPKPVPVQDSDILIECDTLIPAIGQELDIDFVDQKKLLTRKGSYETRLENVFIGGDAMRGASTAINAIGDGRKVAEEIIKKAGLKVSSDIVTERVPLSLKEHTIKRSIRTLQNQAKETPLSNRKNFNLVSQTFSKTEAMKEASRCLLCDEFCSICTIVCPNLAFHTFEITPINLRLQKIIIDDNTYKLEEEEKHFKLSQQYQILHIADWCNECGNCTTFCPTSGAPYKVKPHLYLSFESFEKEKDGYYLNQTEEHDILYSRKENHYSLLARLDDHFVYKSNDIALKIEKDTFRVLDASIIKNDKFELNLLEAVEMNIIMQGAISFYK